MSTSDTNPVHASRVVSPYRCDRRRFIMATAALTVPLLPVTRTTAQEQIEFPTSLSRSDAGSDETYTGDEFGLTVTWDPALWQVKYESPTGNDGIGLLDADVDMNDASADSWFLQVEYQTSHLWTTVDDMKKNSLFEWFSEGMEGSTIVEQWETPDARSWFHTSDIRNTQTLNYIEYSAVDAPNSVWRYAAITIDTAIFDADRASSLFEAIKVDNEEIPRATDLETLVDLLDQHAG